MKISNLILVAGLAAIALCAVGCKKKGCTNPSAQNFDANAEKDDGSCTFSAGNTANTQQAPFVGTYVVSDECDFNGMITYTMTVQAGSNPDELRFVNFGNYGITVLGTIIDGDVWVSGIFDGYEIEGTWYSLGQPGQYVMNYSKCTPANYPCLDPETCFLVAEK